MATVIISAIPVGNDYKNAVARTVDIRLRPRGVILPQAGSPIPRFTISPSDAGRRRQDIRFDASSSIASCFAIDRHGQLHAAGARHDHVVSVGVRQRPDGQRRDARTRSTRRRGTYTAKLTVTNDRGMTNTATKAITITGVANADGGVHRLADHGRGGRAGQRRRLGVAAGAWRRSLPASSTTGRGATAAPRKACVSRIPTRRRGRIPSR